MLLVLKGHLKVLSIATINSLVLQAPRGGLFKGGIYSRAGSDRADTVSCYSLVCGICESILCSVNDDAEYADRTIMQLR